MDDGQSVVIDAIRHDLPHKAISKRQHEASAPQFLSTAEAARMLGLSTTLVQTLVDQGDLKGWKTRGGHRRIALDSIMAYQSASRHITGSFQKPSGKPKVTIVIESLPLLQELIFDYEKWLLPIDVNFFDSVTEALLDLSNSKPDMLVVEMSMPRAQQEKTFQALENFNQRGNSPLSVVLITQEKSLSNGAPVSANSAIQLVSGPLSSVWLHAYLTGVIASCRT
jgi:excisionase family DNA binding protein